MSRMLNRETLESFASKIHGSNLEKVKNHMSGFLTKMHQKGMALGEALGTIALPMIIGREFAPMVQMGFKPFLAFAGIAVGVSMEAIIGKIETTQSFAQTSKVIFKSALDKFRGNFNNSNIGNNNANNTLELEEPTEIKRKNTI